MHAINYINEKDFLKPHQAGGYYIKNKREFETRRGMGFEGELYHEKVLTPLAKVGNDGNGGETTAHWFDTYEKRIEGESLTWDGSIKTIMMTPYQKVLNTFLVTHNFKKYFNDSSGESYCINQTNFIDELSYL